MLRYPAKTGVFQVRRNAASLRTASRYMAVTDTIDDIEVSTDPRGQDGTSQPLARE
ncbi:MAG: hypothetical protein JWR32_4957 [Mycobacterium sp.]|jgi:hypothetical protein|nr:hypothetical protein [Mycobacterium sp.]